MNMKKDATPNYEAAEAWKALLDAVGQIVAYAPQIAAAKRAMFDEYVKAGFTEAQALELSKELLIK